MDDAAEIVVIFDADHHVRADTVATLVSTLIHPDSKLSACQGAVLIERGGYWWLRHRVRDGVVILVLRAGFARLAGSPTLAAVMPRRKKALRQLGLIRHADRGYRHYGPRPRQWPLHRICAWGKS